METLLTYRKLRVAGYLISGFAPTHVDMLCIDWNITPKEVIAREPKVVREFMSCVTSYPPLFQFEIEISLWKGLLAQISLKFTTPVDGPIAIPSFMLPVILAKTRKNKYYKKLGFPCQEQIIRFLTDPLKPHIMECAYLEVGESSVLPYQTKSSH